MKIMNHFTSVYFEERDNVRTRCEEGEEAEQDREQGAGGGEEEQVSHQGGEADDLGDRDTFQ